MQTAYVVDFDGTITTTDISSELAAYYGGSAFMEIEQRYRNREIPIRIWLREIGKLLPADLELLKDQSQQWAVIRPGFDLFLEKARQKGSPVIIASDGFGFYIEPILQREKLLGQIECIYRNETYINEQGIIEVKNPHAHKSCPVCGNCKAAHVVRLKEEGYSIIYIGDGSNDRFGASWSDHVCARDRLAELCREYGFIYSQWYDFYDIIKIDEPGLSDRSKGALCLPMGDGVIT